MKVYIDDYINLATATSPKTILVNLSIKINGSLKHDIEINVSHNESLVQYKIIKEICGLLYEHEYEDEKQQSKEFSYLLESLKYI